MCGIVGFTKFNQKDSYDKAKFLESINHRGPDSKNSIDNENVFFGHSRLSIVDLDNGTQPMRYKDLTIVFNGEIYNHKELRGILVSKGYDFETNSDTEVLLKSFHCWGENFYKQVNGMYAFGIFCSKSKDLYLARDYFGIKPLYFFLNGEDLIFSSEILGVVSVLNQIKADFVIDLDQQKEFLDKGFCSGEIINGIKDVPRGVMCVFKDGKIEYKDNKVPSMPENKKLENILSDEVRLQLEADVEVGVMLSGGIDSSLITAIASETKNNLKTFSVIFDTGNKYDESKYSRLVAQKFKTNHHEFLFNEKKMIQYLPKLIEAMDTPIVDPAMVPSLFLYDEISKVVKVVISGDGGDELFGGYTHHVVRKRKYLFNLIQKFLFFMPFTEDKRRIIKKILSNNMSVQDSMNFDIYNGLDKRLLRKTDICSMRYGVEVRVPFLSSSLYNFTKKQNEDYFFSFLKGKKPLRKLVARMIDKKLAYKNKKGFRVPLKEWILNGRLGKIIKDELFHSHAISPDVISKKQINNLWENKKEDYERLFSLYLLNKWIRKVKKQ